MFKPPERWLLATDLLLVEIPYKGWNVYVWVL
jgi:hypothetical protein